MSIKIEIPQLHVKHLIEFYSKKVDDLRLSIKALENELQEITSIMAQLNTTEQPDNIVYKGILSKAPQFNDGYSVKFTWERKIVFVIEKYGPMTTSEIVDKIISAYQPELKQERKRVVASVSAILSMKSGVGKLFSKSSNDANEFVYHVQSNHRMYSGNEQPELADIL